MAYRDCEDCKKWLYDEETGKPRQRRVGTTKDSQLVNVMRGDVPTPCDDTNQGCAKGHYNNQKTLSVRNEMAYQYIRECRAVNWQGVLVDSVVRRNAALIEQLETSADKAEAGQLLTKAMGLSSLVGGKHGR